MRQRQPIRAIADRPEQEQVDVDHARPVPDAAGGAPQLALDLLARIEQLLGTKRGRNSYAGVEEVALVGHQPNRLGLVHRRGREHVDAVARKCRHRVEQVRPPVADVAAEA